jgi:hypothetical protein
MSDNVTPTSSVDVDSINALKISLTKEINSLHLKLAVSTISSLSTELPGLKSSGRVLKNVILSVQEGLQEGIIKKKTAELDLKKALAEFLEILEDYIRSLYEDKPSLDEVLMQRLPKNVLQPYVAKKDQLQKAIIKTGTFVGYTAVLPLVRPPLDVSKLKRNGISATPFAGYTILDKQFVAGISNDFIYESILPGKKSKEPSAALDDFREIILTKYKHLKIIEIAPPIGWYGATWFWMTTSKEVEIWKKCTINETSVSSIKANKWSFPF